MMTAFVSAPVGLLAGRSTLRPPRSSRLDLHPMRAFHRQPRHEPPTTMLSEADGDGPTAVSGAGSSAVAPTDKGSGGGDRGGLSRRAFVVAAASSAAAAVLAMRPAPATAAAEPATFFDQTASRGGSAVPLRTLFNGKVTLIVNVASYCALTPQYEGLVSLHRKYAAGGEGKRAFDIAAFPCNQFAGQEPGTCCGRSGLWCGTFAFPHKIMLLLRSVCTHEFAAPPPCAAACSPAGH